MTYPRTLGNMSIFKALCKWTKQNALCGDSFLPPYKLQLVTAWLNELEPKN